MNDPFAIRTTEQRVVVLVALLAYFVLFAIQITTDSVAAAALGDLVVAALAIPAGLLVAHRATAGDEADPIPLLAGVSFLVAGVGVGYGGLSALTDLPIVLAVETVGSFALIVAVVLYLYYSWA